MTRAIQRWDLPLAFAACALSLISVIALRSACATLNPALAGRQVLWIALGLLAGTLTAAVPYPRWMDLSAILYVGVILLLLVVELIGTVKLGAARWVTVFGVSLQPSELAKLSTACCVARYLSNQPSPLPLRSLMMSGLIVGVPAALVFVQPDLGSSSILLAVWIGTIWVAGVSRKHIVVVLASALIALPVGWHVLKEYQQARILVFLNPQTDPLGAGYTIIQSEIAIGSGQLVGRGWMAGTQNQLNFLPERHADFLYSVIGEEWGFLGSLAVICCFGILLWRGVHIALGNSDLQGRCLSAALLSWIGYQSVVNIGMVMGLLPVVGVPLPMVSYGGSAMVATWMAVGLLESVHRFGTRF